jgi:serine/threonine-protein kinase RIO1
MDNYLSYDAPNRACYKSREETRRIVEDWFERKLQKMSLEEALHLYCPEPNYVNKIISRL